MTTESSVREIPYWRAENEALRLEMRRDPNIICMGEDQAGGAGREHLGIIDSWGGPFGITRGLIQEFGKERILDTPISEAGFIGAGVGAAVGGLRPWVDLMFTRFAGVAWDQIIHKLAVEHYGTAGQATVRMVLKTFGSCYSPFVHFPGMKCVVPSSPYNVKGLTISALRDDNPVVVFDQMQMLRASGPVPEESFTVPLDKAEVKREGNHITIVSSGWLIGLGVCEKAADELAKEGINAEIVDLISLEPLDEEAILRSVSKTGHLLVVDPDHPRCSIARDIVTLVVEKGFDYLEGPALTLTPPHVPEPQGMGTRPYYEIDAEQIVARAKQVLK